MEVIECWECEFYEPYEDEYREGFCKLANEGKDDIDSCVKAKRREDI